MKKHQGLDLGFVILCPDRNVGGLQNSVWSINRHSYNRDVLCVVGNDVTAQELKEMKVICPTHKGKDTITSLINAGMKHLKHEWGFIMFAGSRIQIFLERKLEVFATDEKDIIFPIVDNRYSFCDGSSNGMLFNKKTFNAIGPWSENKMEKEGLNEFEMAKLFWAMDAKNFGCVFKGIVGLKTI